MASKRQKKKLTSRRSTTSNSSSRDTPHCEAIQDSGKTAKRILRSKVLLSLSVVMFVIAIIFYMLDLNNVASLADSVSADNPFPNPYGIHSVGTFIAVLMCFSSYGICKAVFFLRNPQAPSSKTPWIIAVAVMLVFVSLAQLAYSPATEKLLDKQHSWAEKRYGVTYDGISTFETKSRRSNMTWQDKVIRNGETIAEVCPKQSYEIKFCVPNSTQELSLSLR